MEGITKLNKDNESIHDDELLGNPTSLDSVKVKIESACAKVKRSPKDVHILAVSKKQSVEKIISLNSEGQLSFAENYVQEALIKQGALKDLKLSWHFIGRIQNNKVKNLPGKFELIHSVSSFETLHKMESACVDSSVDQNILLQINLADELSKDGFHVSELSEHLSGLNNLERVKVCGLMCMPPLTESPEESRIFFRNLKEICGNLASQLDTNKHPMNQLSMGTTSDFEIAIQEGATYIRLGRILFGERPE